MMSLINKSADYTPPNYHKTVRNFPKFHGHLKSMNKLTLIEPAIKVLLILIILNSIMQY